MACDDCAVIQAELEDARRSLRYAEETMVLRLSKRDGRIAALEAEVARLRNIIRPPIASDSDE